MSEGAAWVLLLAWFALVLVVVLWVHRAGR